MNGSACRVGLGVLAQGATASCAGLGGLERDEHPHDTPVAGACPQPIGMALP